MRKIIDRLRKLLDNKGESLVEVVVSLAILAILSVAFVTLLMGASGMNLKAIRVTKEDSQISGVFDGDNFANITPTTNVVPEISPITYISFGAADLKISGDYQEAKGQAGEGVVLKRFVPKK